MKKDLISIKDLSLKEINEIFTLAGKLKKSPEKYSKELKGKTLALIFQKPSCRTRVSFEVGMYQLGGNSIYFSPQELNLGVREPVKDIARTLSRYVDGIVLRTFGHKNVIELAEYARVPVINGLSDLEHPAQALADIYTIKEKFGSFKNRVLAYVGDGNNVANSLIYCSVKAGLNFNIGAPHNFELTPRVIETAGEFAKESGARISLSCSPLQAVRGADIIYTDVWTSMGQEKEAFRRKKIFKNFQLNKKLVSTANQGCLIMHCLPAHRGEEITDEVMESNNSIVFDQAENRMHVQKAVLIKLLGNK